MKKFFEFNISDELAGYFESDLSTNRDMEDATILLESGIMPYRDGNQWCVLVGENLQSGICGFGNTIHEAFVNFMKDVKEMQERRNSKQPTIPAGLEEAAEESAHRWFKNPDGSESRELFYQPHIRGFKAGAKWDRAKMMEVLDQWEAHAIRGMRNGATAYHQGKIALITDLRDWINGED